MIRNAIVPVIHDLEKVPWFGYVPLEDGQYTVDQNPIPQYYARKPEPA